MKTPASVTELLQNLIRIPSVNPDGDPGTDQTGERACAEYVRDFLSSLGAEVELREVLPGRPNVIGRIPSRTAKKKILFAPHLDTVAVAGMTIDPFGGEVRDGRIWGRGASDTKGSMASMLWAIQEERRHLESGEWEIWFAGTMGEEAGQHGARALAAQEQFDFVIAGEPTDLKTVHAHKGSTWTQLRTRGKAVHSSRPHEGENAIYKMVEVVRYLQLTVAGEFRNQADPLLGEPTLSVGGIRGGIKTNIVPDFCEIDVDIRTVPSIGTREWADEFQDRLKKEFPGLETFVPMCSPALLTSADHPMVELLAEIGAERTTAPWFCDACVFAEKGMAAAALGPGSIAQAHTIDEFISVEDLEKGEVFFRKLLRKLCD